MSDPTDSLIDTNVVLHAQTNDELSGECKRFLAALQRGTLRARLEPVVLHKLTYVLRRYLKQLDRTAVAAYLRSMLTWPGIQGDIDLMDETLRRWLETPGLSFVDVHLAALAARHNSPIYTKNVRDFLGQGVEVPLTLPS